MMLDSTKIAEQDVIDNALDTIEQYCNRKGLKKIKLIQKYLANQKLNKASSLAKNALSVYAHECERDAYDESNLANISTDLFHASVAEKLLRHNDLAYRLNVVSYAYIIYSTKIHHVDKTISLKKVTFNKVLADLEHTKIDSQTKNNIRKKLNLIGRAIDAKQAQHALIFVRKSLLL